VFIDLLNAENAGAYPIKGGHKQIKRELKKQERQLKPLSLIKF